MMLPEGPSGKIYQYDYSRKVKMCEDFEKVRERGEYVCCVVVWGL